MKKKDISILITNFNKSYFLEKTIKSVFSQKFRNKEILVFDDCSTDNSIKILEKFKKIKLIKNKRKKFKSSPLNQINGIIELFKKSKGELIFLLDGDDQFKKNKIQIIFNEFRKNKRLNFLQDKPYLSEKKKIHVIKKKKSFVFYLAKILSYKLYDLKKVIL